MRGAGTTYLRDHADPAEPPVLHYANAARCFLSNKAPRYFDGNLLAGAGRVFTKS